MTIRSTVWILPRIQRVTAQSCHQNANGGSAAVIVGRGSLVAVVLIGICCCCRRDGTPPSTNPGWDAEPPSANGHMRTSEHQRGHKAEIATLDVDDALGRGTSRLLHEHARRYDRAAELSSEPGWRCTSTTAATDRPAASGTGLGMKEFSRTPHPGADQCRESGPDHQPGSQYGRADCLPMCSTGRYDLTVSGPRGRCAHLSPDQCCGG